MRFRANRAAQTLDGVFRSLLEKVGLTDSAFPEPDFASAAERQMDALFGD